MARRKRKCRRGAGISPKRRIDQRRDETATWVVPSPTFQEAGTWRGSDIAHAATIVASSTRLVHMVASFARSVASKVTRGGVAPKPDVSRIGVGADRTPASDNS